MEMQEIYISPGEKKNLRITEDTLINGSLMLVAHVAEHASLTVDEMLQTTTPCTVRFTALLEGEGASIVDRSSYRGGGETRFDIERTVVHRAPGTSSHVEARGVLGDTARVMWRGRIVVESSAKRARAFQRHDAVLASRDALVDAAPFLEIYTNDVVCKHSASVTRLKPEHLFYIKSRGVAEEDARNMLLEGFLV